MDYISLSYVISLMYVVTFITMILVWKSNRESKAVFSWLISSALTFLGFILILLLPFIGNYVYAINNAIIILSLAFLIRGILAFRNVDESIFLRIFYILAITLVFVFSLIFRNNETGRYLVIDPISALMFLVITFVLLYKQKTNIHIYLLIATFSIIEVITFSIRFMYALLGDFENINGVHPMTPFLFFSIIAWTFVWTIGVLLMIQSKHIDRIESYASIDDMTNIMNRRSFERDLISFFEKSKRNHSFSFSLTIIDIDRFKYYNDNHGHQFGDLVLKSFAEKLLMTFPKYNVYRIGGDEFAIISYDNFKCSDIDKTLEELQNLKIESNNHYSVEVEFSYGCSEYVNEFGNITELYKKADEKMYKLKKERDLVRKERL